MAHLAFNVSIPTRSAAQLAAEARAVGDELARLLSDQFQNEAATVTQATAATTSLIAAVTEFFATGGVAGNITCTGITTANTIIKVERVVDAGQATSDLTAEFTIASAGIINNTGGTNTTSSHLTVIWR